MSKCSLCGDLHYVVKGGIRTPCLCKIMLKLGAYCEKQVKALRSLSQEERELVLSTKFVGDTYLKLKPSVNEALIDSLTLVFLISRGCLPYRIFNVYELLDVYFGNHPEFKSLFHIKVPIVVLGEGYNEFPNIRQSDAILQLLDITKRYDSKVLFVSKKPITSPELVKYFCDQSWGQIDYSGSVGGTSSGVGYNLV